MFLILLCGTSDINYDKDIRYIKDTCEQRGYQEINLKEKMRYALAFCKKNDFCVVSVREVDRSLPMNLKGVSRDRHAFEDINRMVSFAISLGVSVVIDATGVRKEMIDRYMRLAGQYGKISAIGSVQNGISKIVMELTPPICKPKTAKAVGLWSDAFATQSQSA